ncbi:hypothetical protein OAB62_03875 [Pseudomonadales bacterium]|nr:hypothetical protein [Pseudomonadales bacterium]
MKKYIVGLLLLSLAGCDKPIKIQEVLAPNLASVDVYCTPWPEISKYDSGYDIVIKENTATVWVRRYDLLKEKSNGYKEWGTYWAPEENLAVKPIHGKNRILLQGQAGPMILKSITAAERIVDEYPSEVSWLLYDEPATVSHLCYEGRMLDQGTVRSIYITPGVFELKMRSGTPQPAS